MPQTDWTIEGPSQLHIVDGDRPVATFHDRQDAAVALACVLRVNGTPRTGLNGTRPEIDLKDFPMVVREIIENGHPFYGVNLDEVLRDWELAIHNAQYRLRERAEAAERRAEQVADDSKRVAAVRHILRGAGKRKTLESHAVAAALTNPEWRLQQPNREV